MLWNVHGQLTLDLPDAAQAVAQAIESEQHPVILVEMGDNIGGGSPGDSTFRFGGVATTGGIGIRRCAL